MAEFEHRVLTPFEVGQPALMGDTPQKLREQLLTAWLLEVIGHRTITQYPARTCSGLTGGWEQQPSGHSIKEFAVATLSTDDIDELAESASNNIRPEPLSKIHYNGGYIIKLIGFGVSGMGHNFDAMFYQGPTPIRQIPSPENSWVFRGLTLATDQPQ